MLQFDLTVFLAQCALFLFFLFFFDRFVLSPIFAVLERRRKMLNTENEHAFESRRTSAELKERYRREIEEVHRSGGILLVNTKARANTEAQSYLEELRRKMHTMVESKKSDIEELSLCTSDELEDKRHEMLDTLSRALWGGGRS
jgi:F0F1-type ATP synthase membrane subunit b/b'